MARDTLVGDTNNMDIGVGIEIRTGGQGDEKPVIAPNKAPVPTPKSRIWLPGFLEPREGLLKEPGAAVNPATGIESSCSLHPGPMVRVCGAEISIPRHRIAARQGAPAQRILRLFDAPQLRYTGLLTTRSTHL